MQWKLLLVIALCLSTDVCDKQTLTDKSPTQRKAALVSREVRLEDNQKGGTGWRNGRRGNCAELAERLWVGGWTVVQCHAVETAGVFSF